MNKPLLLRFCMLVLLAGFGLAAEEPDPATTPPPVAQEEPIPIVKPAPALRVITWNIQYGADEGDFSNRWSERKKALKVFLAKEEPDILCVQEALKGQVEFIEKLFPKHKRLGVGRDDGVDGGEFCAIWFDPQRVNLLESGTFWLGETPDKPCKSWADKHPRICTWARFEDPFRKKTFRIYNTHFPLNPIANEKAARQINKRLREQHPEEPALLLGDFNAGTGSDSWKILYRTGLRNTEIVAQKKILSRTLHVDGFPTTCIDAIFAGAGWGVADHRLLDKRLDKVFPSDHFGIAVDLYFANPQDPRAQKVEPEQPFKPNQMEPLETLPPTQAPINPPEESHGEK